MYKIVKFVFPFADDIDKGKPRPSLVLSPSFGKHNQLILAYITANVKGQLGTDIFLDSSKPYFRATGLHVPSLLKLHRLITVTPSQIGITMGVFPDELIPELKKRLKKVFLLK